MNTDNSPLLFYCQLCDWQFWLRPGDEPHQCVPPIDGTVSVQWDGKRNPLKEPRGRVERTEQLTDSGLLRRDLDFTGVAVYQETHCPTTGERSLERVDPSRVRYNAVGVFYEVDGMPIVGDRWL